MPFRTRQLNCLCAAVLGIALAGPASAAPVQLGPPVFNLTTFGFTWPGPGTGMSLGEKSEADLVPGESHVVLSSSLGTAGGTVVNHLRAVMASDGLTYLASASAPQQFAVVPPADFIGGITSIELYRSYRKSSDTDSLRFSFSQIELRLGWEKEFGIKCQPAGPDCQYAQFSSRIDLYEPGGLDPVWTTINQMTAESIGDSTSNPGYDFHRSGDIASFPATVGNTRYGIDVRVGSSLLPFTVPVDLSAVTTPEFIVQHTLYVIAYDRDGHIAPGRFAFAGALDPLDAFGGVRIEAVGLTPWEEIVVSDVPAPSTFALALVGLGALIRVRRR